MKSLIVFLFVLTLPASAYGMGGNRPAPPPGSVAADRRMISFTQGESCSAPEAHEAPSSLTTREGRLIDSLRQAARRADPLTTLVASAKSFLSSREALGRAYADLCVTGLKNYAAFKRLHVQGLLNELALVGRLRTDPTLGAVPTSDLLRVSARALDRAYASANAIAAGGASQERARLGWIAVSGEDDHPYRPVNVPSSVY